MDFTFTPEEQQLRCKIRDFCNDYPPAFWRQKDRERAYPQEIVTALTHAGYLSALIPKEYGGLGLGVSEAGIILEEINRSGGNSAGFHGQMYIMGALLRHGSDSQKDRWLPDISSGKSRLQAFSVTEKEAGSETTNIQTFARREGANYIISGHKNWTSRIQQSDLMLLLARTTPSDEVTTRSDGLSLFMIDLQEARRQRDRLIVNPVRTMINYETFEVTYRDLVVPVENLIGEEGMGFHYIIDGWNAERILLASECIGDGYWFIDKAVKYASSREVFGAPIGKNQGVQFPLARVYSELIAADLVRYKAASLFDSQQKCGAEANMAKLLSADASWKAANICLDTHGGNGFLEEYDIERKFRETRLFQVAPVNNNMVLSFIATHVLGLPKSY